MEEYDSTVQFNSLTEPLTETHVKLTTGFAKNIISPKSSYSANDNGQRRNAVKHLTLDVSSVSPIPLSSPGNPSVC